MISDAGSGRLELASVERQEILRDEDTLMILGDRLSLGTSVAEIKVPVIYRYYVSLDDPWQMEIKEGFAMSWLLDCDSLCHQPFKPNTWKKRFKTVGPDSMRVKK